MRRFGMVFGAVALFVGACQGAFAQVVLPATGIDVEDYITLLVTGLGTGLAAIIGASFAFMIVKKLWAKSRAIG